MGFSRGYLVSIKTIDKENKERINYISRFFINNEDTSAIETSYQVVSTVQNAIIFPYRELPFLKKLLDKIPINDRKNIDILRLDIKPSKVDYFSKV